MRRTGFWPNGDILPEQLWMRISEQRSNCSGLHSCAKGATLRNSCDKEVRLSEIEPISLRSRNGASPSGPAAQSSPSSHPAAVAFNLQELRDILNVYGRKVAAGEWRDYAMDFGREKAVFSVFRRASEFPLYRIEKNPRLARKQGAYSVIAATGLILKRGHDLRRVLGVFEKSLRLVE
jgi:hypothetical protein